MQQKTKNELSKIGWCDRSDVDDEESTENDTSVEELKYYKNSKFGIVQSMNFLLMLTADIQINK